MRPHDVEGFTYRAAQRLDLITAWLAVAVGALGAYTVLTAVTHWIH